MGKTIEKKQRMPLFTSVNVKVNNVKANKDLVKEMEHSLKTMEMSLQKIETTLSKTYDGKPMTNSNTQPKPNCGTSPLITKKEPVLKSLYTNKNKLNHHEGPTNANEETQSEFDLAMESLMANTDKTPLNITPKNQFQNYKFKNQVVEFGDKNIFLNCAFIQCPLKFGPNNVFKNCRDLHLKVVPEPDPESSPPSEMDVNPKTGKAFRSTVSQTEASTNYNNYNYYYNPIQLKASIPSIYYSLV